MMQTPYGLPQGRYGYYWRIGESSWWVEFVREGYIFVVQDIRGRYKSGGEFIMMRPPNPGGIDEGTDTYDTIDWLLQNVSGNNGQVGIFGVSYDGWLAVMAKNVDENFLNFLKSGIFVCICVKYILAKEVTFKMKIGEKKEIDVVLVHRKRDNRIELLKNTTPRGCIPTLGIHLGKRITPAIDIEGFLTGGLLFAQCRYFYKYQDMALTEININLSNTEYLLLELDRKGKGTGFALKGGARINVDIGENFGLFLEGGYAYRIVNKIYGPGSCTEDFQTRTWQGDWGIKGWIVTKDWGDQYFQSPSNYWPNQEERNLKIRNFKLDLSGFLMSIGIYYRF
jgi:hypothetical protein